MPSQFSIRAVLSYLSTRDQVKALVTGINTKGLAFFRAHIENSPDFSDSDPRESFPDPKFMVTCLHKEDVLLMDKVDLTHCADVYIDQINFSMLHVRDLTVKITEFFGRHLPFCRLHIKTLHFDINY